MHKIMFSLYTCLPYKILFIYCLWYLKCKCYHNSEKKFLTLKNSMDYGQALKLTNIECAIAFLKCISYLCYILYDSFRLFSRWCDIQSNVCYIGIDVSNLFSFFGLQHVVEQWNMRKIDYKLTFTATTTTTNRFVCLTVSGNRRPNVSGKQSASKPATKETAPNNRSGSGRYM